MVNQMAKDSGRQRAEKDLHTEPLIRMYEFHKREFGLEDNSFLRLFGELLSRPPCSILECSAKISPEGMHAARFRLGYEQGDIREGLDQIAYFVGSIAASDEVILERGILWRIVDGGLDLSRVMAAGVGLDHRENGKDSKVKCYFMIADCPEKVDQILSLCGPIGHIREYLIHEVFMFGIDMYFDGRTGIEIYPFLDSQDLRNATLMDKLRLRHTVHGFAEECSALHISFEDGGRRVLHFHPQSPTRFVRLIGNRQLSLLYTKVQILNLLLSRLSKTEPVSVNLSLVEDEIISENIEHINLQYALTSRVWERQ
jgi:LynF/TruF/PatF family peptide O-prenyltransferase